jgi:hypothetical protein
MNKCAFVIPLHPKHYEYGKYIINELQNTDADLYFVFSNLTDKNLFQEKIGFDTKLCCLILEDFVDLSIVGRTNSYVSIKKLYALSVLYDKYDFISCIDSEIKFINKTNFYDMMNNVVNNKKIIGGKITSRILPEKGIIKDSLTRITETSYHSELQRISQDFSIYTWWSNLPVCDCKIVKHFLDWISFSNTNIDRFVWNVFDDMLYNYFCILLYNYELVVIPNIYHSLEFANTVVIENVNNNICKLYWTNINAYKQNPQYYDNNNFYILFHLDRK